MSQDIPYVTENAIRAVGHIRSGDVHPAEECAIRIQTTVRLENILVMENAGEGALIRAYGDVRPTGFGVTAHRE